MPPEEFFSAADCALYDAKILGRNRVNRELLPDHVADR
jgi:PleD family two-component response regulator